jgi:formylglycine-generating enzyme required for sulfatase activity
MKSLIIKFSLCSLCLLNVSYKFSETETIKWPPFYGMKNCASLFYIDETEVTVDSWISYYNWILINEGIEKANEVLPDSNGVSRNIWIYIRSIKPLKPNAFIATYGTHTGQPIPTVLKECPDLIIQDSLYQTKKEKRCPYGHYPITGLSYQQVIDFCKWRTTMLGHDTIEYRLPSPEEWNTIAIMSLMEDEKANRTIDSLCQKKKNCAAFNYKLTKSCQDYNKWGKDGQSIKPVGMFYPNIFGVYDFIGNVSEMTLTPCIAMGGNYSLYASKCHIDSIQKYNNPEKWLGFRCIVKIK